MSNISQDGRETHSTFGDEQNTIVYVEYLATGFQWGTSTSSMQPLATTLGVENERPVTFEFVRVGSTPIWYKLPPSATAGTVLPTGSPGPTAVVDPGTRKQISFATTNGGPYFAGSVTVSDDGVDDLLGGGDSSDADDDPVE